MEVQLPHLITHSFPTTRQWKAIVSSPNTKPPLRCQFCSSLLCIIPSHTSVSSSLLCPRTLPCPSCTCGQSLGPTDRQGSGLSTRSKLTAAPVPIPRHQIPVSQHPSLSQNTHVHPYIQYHNRNSLDCKKEWSCKQCCMSVASLKTSHSAAKSNWTTLLLSTVLTLDRLQPNLTKTHNNHVHNKQNHKPLI